LFAPVREPISFPCSCVGTGLRTLLRPHPLPLPRQPNQASNPTGRGSVPVYIPTPERGNENTRKKSWPGWTAFKWVKGESFELGRQRGGMQHNVSWGPAVRESRIFLISRGMVLCPLEGMVTVNDIIGPGPARVISLFFLSPSRLMNGSHDINPMPTAN